MAELRTNPTLKELQAWVQARVTRSPQLDTLRNCSLFIQKTPAFGVEYRLNTYATSWYLRLEESLAEDYEVLASLIGVRAFSRLVKAYLRAHPSSYFTLAYVGNFLPEFLETWQDPKLKIWHADLARIERGVYLAFFAKNPQPWDTRLLASMSPEKAEALPLSLEASVSLVKSAWDLFSVWKGTRKKPEEKLSYHLIYRNGFEVLVEKVSSREYAVLESLQGGLRLGELIDRFPSQKTVKSLSKWTSSGIVRVLLTER